ncbi:MAG: hypothetical protein GX834_00110, partial [Clostridiaceae bacterium]|nr:hypothetical protein [Clostridiaceae bacterium]
MCKNTRWEDYTSSQGHKITFPIATIKGANPGTRLLITSGLQGCDYSGIAAAIELFNLLASSAVRGTVDIIT